MYFQASASLPPIAVYLWQVSFDCIECNCTVYNRTQVNHKPTYQWVVHLLSQKSSHVVKTPPKKNNQVVIKKSMLRSLEILLWPPTICVVAKNDPTRLGSCTTSSWCQFCQQPPYTTTTHDVVSTNYQEQTHTTIQYLRIDNIPTYIFPRMILHDLILLFETHVDRLDNNGVNNSSTFMFVGRSFVCGWQQNRMVHVSRLCSNHQ